MKQLHYMDAFMESADAYEKLFRVRFVILVSDLYQCHYIIGTLCIRDMEMYQVSVWYETAYLYSMV